MTAPTPLYVTPTDLRQALAPDGDRVGTAAELDDDQLSRALRQAQDLVDATTGSTYTDDNAPALVIGLVLALGAYYSTLRYRKGKELSQFHPVYLQYQDARLTLTQIKQGLLNTTPGADADQPAVNAGPSVFQPAGLQGGTLFTLDDTGLAIKTGQGGPPTVDPALNDWGVI